MDDKYAAMASLAATLAPNPHTVPPPALPSPAPAPASTPPTTTPSATTTPPATPPETPEEDASSTTATAAALAVMMASEASPAPATAVSGQYAMSVLQYASSGREGGGGEAGSGGLSEAVVAAAAEERSHEIIGLGETCLAINTRNWTAMKAGVDPMATALVVSFLGETSAGKSHTIRELMAEGESRPFCQDASEQNKATTFNVNLYPCASLVPGATVNLVDYEGENGSDTPVMAAARALRLTGPGKSRHQAVAEFFPKLAYTTSDVLVMVSRQPFFNRDYLTRCVELAKRANAGVHNVDQPALILVGNKIPGQECVLDVKQSTQQFYDAWGEEANELDRYFSVVVCIYMPHKRGLWYDADDRVVQGSEVFTKQLDKLKSLLAQLVTARAESRPRLITQHQGLWYSLLPLVLRDLNAGHAVNVSALIDEAWASAMAETSQADDSAMDVFQSFMTYLRPPRRLSTDAPLLNEDILIRFDAYRSLVLAVSCRLLACRLRALERDVLVGHKVRAFTTQVIRDVLFMLGDLTPCVAAYEGAGVAVDRPRDPVICLQEFRVHRTHRTSRRVRGGTGLWGKLSGMLPYNETWKGDFVAPKLPDVDEDALVDGVVEALGLSPSEFMGKLVDLQRGHTSPRVSIGFARLQPEATTGPPSARAPPRPPGVVSRLPSTAAHDLNLAMDRVVDGSMVHCVACGRKVNTSTREEAPAAHVSWVRKTFHTVLHTLGLSDGAATSPSDSPTLDASPEPAVVVAPRRRRKSRRRSGEGVLSSGGGPVDGAGPLPASPAVTAAPSHIVSSPGPSWGSPSARVAVHNVWLGLCGQCWEDADVDSESSDEEGGGEEAGGGSSGGETGGARGGPGFQAVPADDDFPTSRPTLPA